MRAPFARIDPVNTVPAAGHRLPLLVWLALFCVYVIWGSTYLAIRFALEAYPPMFFPALRFLVAGTILFVFMAARGAALPTIRQWRNAAVIGFLLLNVGNGAVVFAQQSVGSGLAATAVATMPLWAALAGGIWGQWPARMQWLGLVIGFVGIALLNLDGDFAAHPLAAVMLITASMSWAFGSVWSRRLDLPKGPMSTACQMLVAGALFLVVSGLRGESWALVTTPKAMAAVAHLAIFGSVVAFSAYIWLVQNVSAQLATSYAYVNPVIALLLGVTLAGETVTDSEGVAIALVLAGVVLIVLNNRSAAGKAAAKA